MKCVVESNVQPSQAQQQVASTAAELAGAQATNETLRRSVEALEQQLAAVGDECARLGQQADAVEAAHSMRLADMEQQWQAAREETARLQVEKAALSGECTGYGMVVVRKGLRALKPRAGFRGQRGPPVCSCLSRRARECQMRHVTPSQRPGWSYVQPWKGSHSWRPTCSD